MNTPAAPTHEKIIAFAETLEQWSESHGRQFPWRKTRNAFHLLLAELLLRKTQAERVQPIYEQICKYVAEPADLMRFGPERLRSLIQPLGLQARFDWLLELSKEIIRKHNGRVPSTYKGLVALKGVGPYTANFTLCVAFDQNTLPIDNNIARLVCRVFGVRRIGDTRRERDVENLLREICRLRDVKTLAFAMLDFAAAVCRAKKPECLNCPLSEICSWVAPHVA